MDIGVKEEVIKLIVFLVWILIWVFMLGKCIERYILMDKMWVVKAWNFKWSFGFSMIILFVDKLIKCIEFGFGWMFVWMLYILL